jgi:CCR4-NOT transcription complex subunit 9
MAHQQLNILQLVLDLTDHAKRERALDELSKKRESYAELAPILWHSIGTVSAILQEIVSIYPRLTPPTLSTEASNKVRTVFGLTDDGVPSFPCCLLNSMLSPLLGAARVL